MSNALIDKIRLSRLVKIQVGPHTFTIQRPTDLDMARMTGQAGEEILRKFVVDWDVKEIDLIPGGSPVAVPFDPDLFYEWICDQPQCWEPLISGISNAYKVYSEGRSETEKKPEAG